MKNKRGFTLVEMMITVAIIVIVAAAGTVGIIVSLRRNQEKTAELSAGAQNFESEAIAGINQFNASNEYVPPVQTKLPDPTDASEESTVESSASSEETEATTTTATPTPIPTATPIPETTKAPSGGGGSSNSSGTVSTSSTVSGTDSSVGVVSISSSDNPTVTVSQGWNNNCTFDLTRNSSGTYTMSNISQKWVVGGIHDIWNSNTITLNSSDISYLSNTFNLNLN